MAEIFHPASAIALADGSTLITLHDGVFRPGAEVLIDPAGEAETDALRARFPDGLHIDVNAFALQRDGETILIDAGAGSAWGPALGNVGRTLASIGIAAADIRTVLLTHPHGDHAFGLVDAAGGLAYPNAEVFCSGIDIDHFSSQAAIDGADGQMSTRAVFARLGSRLRAFGPGELLPGVEAVPLPGHTPGHSGFLLASLMLIWGDLIHLPREQAPDPAISLIYDDDRAMATMTRRDTLTLTAERQWLVAGSHLPFPAIGRVTPHGHGHGFTLTTED